LPTAEANVLGAVVKNKDISTILGEDAEVFGAYADVFTFVKSHYAQYKAVPEIALLESKFDEIDIPTNTTSPTPYYLTELKNQFVAEKMATVAAKAMEALDSGKGSPRILARLQTELAKLGRYTDMAQDIDITNIEWAKEHFLKLRERALENDGSPGLATGFKSIDSAYPTGMGPGHLIVVMGYTGRGKSFFAAKLAANVREQMRKSMVVSLEMSPEEQMERLYAVMSPGTFRISDLSRGDVSEDDLDAFEKKVLKDSPPFIVVSNKGNSEMTMNVAQAKFDQHRPDFMVFDYAQLMMDNGKTQAMTPRMLNMSRETKLFGVSNNIPVVLITAVTDEDNDKRDGPPLLSQVAWSKGIEYDANLAIAAHIHDDTDIMQVAGRKNRHGPLFNFGLKIDLDAGLWEEKFDLF